MSKNTQISELINYISVDGSGNVVLSSGQLVATQSYVSTAITNLVNSAPSTLDTLNELATALGNDPNFATTIATSIGTKQAQLNGTGFVKITGTTVSYDNSTYALDSVVVKLTGSQTISGVKTFTGAGNTFTQNTNFQDRIYLKSPTTTTYSSLGGDDNKILVGVIGATHEFTFTPNTNYSYVFPAASGTVALTSNLSSYLPLTGGTLTGALSGTSATFSGAVSLINTLNLYKTGGTTLGGQLAYDSTINQLYLWNNVSSGYFSIYTNSTERLTILPGGNVGLGTNSPIKNLQVYASNGSGIGIGRNLTNDNFSANLFFYPSSISADKRNWAITTYYGAPGLMEFRRSVTSTSDPYDNGVTLMSLDSINDYVGIGTSTPTAKLHVKGDNAKIRVSGPTYTSVEIEDGGTGDPGYIRTYTYGTANCQIGDGGTYFNTGNIGFGTSSPSYNIDVQGTEAKLQLKSTAAGGGTYVLASTYSAWSAGGGKFVITSDGGTAGIKFAIDDTGNIGIGTYSPAQKLHVKSGTNYQGILINGSNAPAIGFAKGDGTTPEWKLGISGNDGTAISISSGAANTDRIIIGSNANVGIGAGVSGNYRLNVGGAIQANRSIYNWYQGSYTGNSTYLHIKTNMWCGGSPYGNSEYTMSLFKGYSYSYGTPPAQEGTIVFHNWDGNFYNIGTTGNLFVTAYKSADGYVVLVTNSGSGESGVTIDWHQAYGYPFRDRTVSTTKLYGATTGGY